MCLSIQIYNKKFSFFFVFKIELTSTLAAKYCSLVSQHKLNGAVVRNESTTGGHSSIFMTKKIEKTVSR